MQRRDFFVRSAQGMAAMAAGYCCAGSIRAGEPPLAAEDHDFVEGVEQVIIRRRGLDKHGWCHARGCMAPGPDGARALLTVQPIYGSDYFGQVHWIESADLGRTWSEPQPIPSLGYRKVSEELRMGVCDVVPEYHPPTRSVLAIGHNVFYKKQFFKPQPPRWPVYVVRGPDGNWSDAKRLEWEDPRTTAIYSCGCAQRITLPSGEVLIPLTFRPAEREDNSVTSVLAGFDGRDLSIRQLGNELRLPVLRGLLEPSLAEVEGRYYMTIRAEDNHGYVTTSEDGLHWRPITPWCWDDGEPLAMSTTQQRWLVHSDALYLVYTRKSKENEKLFRWRAPLYMAMVDRARLRLVRSTERIAIPMEGDPNKDPKRVAQLGNFHTMAVNAHESWITVATFDIAAWQGSIRMARVAWSRPNRRMKSEVG